MFVSCGFPFGSRRVLVIESPSEGDRVASCNDGEKMTKNVTRLRTDRILSECGHERDKVARQFLRLDHAHSSHALRGEEQPTPLP